jgi:hypothetical protein
MAEQQVEFRRVREFGENINDTFLFIRQNFAPLLKSFFAICALFILAQAIFNGLYQSQALGIFAEILSGRRTGGGRFGAFDQVTSMNQLMAVLFSLLSFVSMNVTIGAYVKHYVETNGRRPGIEEVWNLFKKYFFKVLAFSIPVYLSVIIGCLFCLLPGIYLMVVFVPFSLVVMIEDTNFSDAYYRCFELIRENFWPSFAVYLVVYLIYYLCGFIIGGLFSAIIGLGAYLTTDDFSAPIGLATSFFTVFSVCFYMIFFVSAAFQYFSLVEKREGTGILTRINTIGQDKHNADNQEDQF